MLTLEYSQLQPSPRALVLLPLLNAVHVCMHVSLLQVPCSFVVCLQELSLRLQSTADNGEKPRGDDVNAQELANMRSKIQVCLCIVRCFHSAEDVLSLTLRCILSCKAAMHG